MDASLKKPPKKVDDLALVKAVNYLTLMKNNGKECLQNSTK